MSVQELICISCPLGCPLRVELGEGGEVLSVSGNTCKRGEEYARKEVTAPTRTVTSTIQVENGIYPVTSVRTRQDIPKDKIFACMEEIYRVRAQAPIELGDVLISNVAQTGVDVIATRAVAIKEE